jgi:hypothetical protein
MIHDNSIKAHKEGTELFKGRKKDVYEALLRLRHATDRHVMRYLEFTDPNAVRPRITELIGEGWVAEIGMAKDSITGKHVRVLKALTAKERDALMSMQMDLFTNSDPAPALQPA